MKKVSVIFLLLILVNSRSGGSGALPVWPPPPDNARIEFVKEIRCSDLSLQRSFLGSAVRLISGGSADEKLRYPFDLEVMGEKLFLTCRNLKALVEIDQAEGSFRIHKSKSRPFQNPVGLCVVDRTVFITDSESKTVYSFDGKKVVPLITTGLDRPTGIAYLPAKQLLYVVDTGSHQVKIFDLTGKTVGTLGKRGSAGQGFNFPTFSSSRSDQLLINDTLNYRIKIFSSEGELLSCIGSEGDGPGAFARPKGVAADVQGNVYVVDSLFDNIQVFDSSGRILLVIGSAGLGLGQFWSPAGIEIDGDLIYIADTFNDRIQVLRYIRG